VPNFKPSFLTRSLILGTSLALSGCGSSSDSKVSVDPKVSALTSRFEFKVTNPADGQLASNALGQSVKQLLGMIIPTAHAALGDQNIQVAIVDFNGVVTQLVTPKEPLKQEADGTYVVILEGGVRLDCVILVTLNDPSNIKVGDRIDDSGALYTPTVDTAEPLDIDLASTVAFDLFIKEVESFENITPKEVDRLIERAQEIVKNSGITAATTEALTELISAEITSFVKTEILLAELSDETATQEQPSTGSIESDRAKIKGFFDDINTLAVVLPSKFDDAEDKDTFQNIRTDADAAQAVLEGASSTLDDFASLQATLQTGLGGFQLGAADLSITTIFAGDSKANLTGTVSLTNTAASFTMTGNYGALTVVDLNVAVAFSSVTNTPVTVTLAGKVASTDATIELSNGLIELHSNDLVSESVTVLDKTDAQSAAADTELESKLISVNAALGIHLIVHKDAQNLSEFTGNVSIEAVRSSKDYREFAGDDAVPFYNLKSIALDGRFTLGENVIAAKASFTQNNAADYTPLTQELVEGTVYNNLFSYDYNGTDAFVFHTPEYVSTLAADSTYEYKVLHAARDVRRYEKTYRAASFTALAERLYSGSGLSENLDVTDLVQGLDQALPLEGVVGTYSYSDTLFSLSSANYGNRVTFHSYEFVSQVGDFITVAEVQYSYYIDLNISSTEEYLSRGQYINNAFYAINSEDLIKGENQTLDAQLVYSFYNFSDDVNDSQPQTLSITYNYSDDSFVTTNLGDDNIEISFLKVEEYAGLKVESTVRVVGNSFTYETYMDYVRSKGTFTEYLSRQYSNLGYSYYYAFESIGDVSLTFPVLTTGEGIVVPAEVRSLNSLEDYENATNFQAYSYFVELESSIESIGDTVIKANLERIGYSNGVITLTLSHTDSNSLLSDISIQAAFNRGDLGSVNVSNSDGFVLSKDDVVDGDEEATITFGLETATVIGTDTGLKVSYSDGTFDLY
jgi:hypothetical protein